MQARGGVLPRLFRLGRNKPGGGWCFEVSGGGSSQWPISQRHGSAGNCVKAKQWRLNDPIKSGQDEAIRAALIVIGREKVGSVVESCVARRSEFASRAGVFPGDAFPRLCSAPGRAAE